MCAFINVNPRHHVDMRQKTNAKNKNLEMKYLTIGNMCIEFITLSVFLTVYMYKCEVLLGKVTFIKTYH